VLRFDEEPSSAHNDYEAMDYVNLVTLGINLNKTT